MQQPKLPTSSKAFKYFRLDWVISVVFIIAAGHKILRVIFKLLFSTDKGYTDPKVGYEELMVNRNTPRWIKCLSQYGYLIPVTA